MWNRFVEFMLGTPTQRRNKKIIKMHINGKSMVAIGVAVVLSRERVRQILNENGFKSNRRGRRI